MLVKAQYHVPVETYDYLAQVSREEGKTPGAKLHEIVTQYKNQPEKEGGSSDRTPTPTPTPPRIQDGSPRKRGKHS